MNARWLFLITLLTLSLGFTADKEPWVLGKDSDGIKVYTRENTETGIKEFKAESVFKADIDSLELILDNISSYSEWQSNVSTVKVLEELDSIRSIAYYTAELPWPVSDRDMVIHSEKELVRPGLIIYHLTGRDKYLPENEDFVRIKDIQGNWTIEDLGEGKVYVKHQLYGDGGGNIPRWVLNMFIVDGPHETLINLKKMID